MSKCHRLEAILKRISLLRSSIATDTELLSSLERKASLMSAEVAVESQPESMRNCLVESAMSTNSEPRKPVVRE